MLFDHLSVCITVIVLAVLPLTPVQVLKSFGLF